MNQRLKFSWSHIIAFVALIAVSYISFVGYTYLTNGNFTIGLIGMGVTDILYLIFFIGAQQIKNCSSHFRRNIVWERILVFGSPLVFVAGMIAMAHFFTVRAQEKEVVTKFNSSINDARLLFDDYQKYCNDRIDSYSKGLDIIIANMHTKPYEYAKAGFNDADPMMQKKNMVETLRLQLLSKNFVTLNQQANKWINDANQGASTINVFLLGNTTQIKEAIENWERILQNTATHHLTNEEIVHKPEEFTSQAARKAIKGIDSLHDNFTTMKFPTLWAILFGLLIYVMLIFPYIIQTRHTKSLVRLIGNERSHNGNDQDEFDIPIESSKETIDKTNEDNYFPDTF